VLAVLAEQVLLLEQRGRTQYLQQLHQQAVAMVVEIKEQVVVVVLVETVVQVIHQAPHLLRETMAVHIVVILWALAVAQAQLVLMVQPTQPMVAMEHQTVILAAQ